MVLIDVGVNGGLRMNPLRLAREAKTVLYRGPWDRRERVDCEG
jgi:hypothetical protein